MRPDDREPQIRQPPPPSSPVFVSVRELESKPGQGSVFGSDAPWRLYDLVVDDQTITAYAQVFEVLLLVFHEPLALQRNCGC